MDLVSQDPSKVQAERCEDNALTSPRYPTAVLGLGHPTPESLCRGNCAEGQHSLQLSNETPTLSAYNVH